MRVATGTQIGPYEIVGWLGPAALVTSTAHAMHVSGAT
jgi:hypothetical protein